MMATGTRASSAFVKAARARLGRTQAELADDLGLERRSIIRFESGRDEPRLCVRHAISYMLLRLKLLEDKRRARATKPK